MQDLTIAFDLDGTLVETAPDLIRATNHVLGSIGEPPVPSADLRSSISFGARAMIVKALNIRRVRLPETEIDGLFELFLAHYTENIAVESHPYPGLEAALDQMTAAGARLAVCTNKVERLATQLLDELGLTARFAAIVGGDTFGVGKPDPTSLLGAIERAGGDRDRAIMVGDSAADVGAARAVGAPVVVATFGYTITPPQELGGDALIDHFDELEGAIERLGFS